MSFFMRTSAPYQYLTPGLLFQPLLIDPFRPYQQPHIIDTSASRQIYLRLILLIVRHCLNVCGTQAWDHGMVHGIGSLDRSYL